MTSSLPTLLILGGSSRAAADSAVRAGFHPICADRFGDVDLHRVATVLPVSDYPQGLLAATESLPPTHWIYVGALENEPELIESISRRHPLLGNRPSVLERIRDPFWVEQTLRDHGLPALNCLTDNEQPPASRKWLAKPFHSGGGVGIRFANENNEERNHQQRMYFQEWRDGRSISAIFIASSTHVRLIGMSEQLIGSGCGAPSEFGYAGSIGPIELSPSASLQIQQIGTLLAHEAKLLGLFGCDFILADNFPWLIEVNPRYTASVEVLERATSWPLLKWHVAACLESSTAANCPGSDLDISHALGKRVHNRNPTELASVDSGLCTTTSRFNSQDVMQEPHINRDKLVGADGLHHDDRNHNPVIGKRIAFASSDSLAPDLEKLIATDSDNESSIWQSSHNEPLLADIPAPGSSILAGWPICTVFVRSNNFATCRELLEMRASAIKRWTESSSTE